MTQIRISTPHLTLGYYAKSTEIRWNMIKSYAFLVLIIIIMPTFGFTYLTQVFDNLIKDDISDANRMWQCFFLADSGKRSFFNYLSKAFFLLDKYKLSLKITNSSDFFENSTPANVVFLKLVSSDEFEPNWLDP